MRHQHEETYPSRASDGPSWCRIDRNGYRGHQDAEDTCRRLKRRLERCRCDSSGGGRIGFPRCWRFDFHHWRFDFHHSFGAQERSNVGPPWLYLPGSLAYAMVMDKGCSDSDDTAGKGCDDELMFTFDSKKSERSAKK